MLVKVFGRTKKVHTEELSKYNGQDGNPAYVGYKGKVYDVSDSSFWIGGDHLGTHQAGKDLTDDMDMAPHGPENLDRVELVGVLA